MAEETNPMTEASDVREGGLAWLMRVTVNGHDDQTVTTTISTLRTLLSDYARLQEGARQADEDLREPLLRFSEALEVEPAISERVAAGQQFNAYELADDDGGVKALCLGPITSKPVSLCEAPASVAELLECALRVAMKARARLSARTGEGAALCGDQT